MDSLVVRLRPFEEGDLWYFEREAKDRSFSAPFEWGGFKSPESYRRRWDEDGLLGSSPYFLVVAAAGDDSLVGVVDWRHNERPGAGVWEIGVLIVPEQRGRGAGTEAQRQLVDYLFLTTPCNRVWAPKWRTSPSSALSNEPASCARLPAWSSLPRRPMAGQLHLRHHAQRLEHPTTAAGVRITRS